MEALKLIGPHVRPVRKALRLTQTQFALRLRAQRADDSGRAWTQSDVSELENNSFENGTWADLDDLVTVSGLPLTWWVADQVDLRALDQAIPGFNNHDTLPARLSRRILQNGQREQSRVGHGIDGCIDELFDPWVHAVEDYSEERGWFDPRAVREQIPGQTEFIISIEKMLMDVA